MAETSDFAAKAKPRHIFRVSQKAHQLPVFAATDCSDATEFDEEAEDDKDYSYSDVSDAVETPSPGAKGSEFISFNPNVGKQFLCKLSKR